MKDVVELIKGEQEKGNTLLVVFKNEKLYILPEDKVEAFYEEFIYIEAKDLTTGQDSKSFFNFRELRKITVKEPRTEETS